jgi:hypothetical protein
LLIPDSIAASGGFEDLLPGRNILLIFFIFPVLMAGSLVIFLV